MRLIIRSLWLTTVSGFGSSPTRGKCATSEDLVGGVTGGVSRGSSLFAQPTNVTPTLKFTEHTLAVYMFFNQSVLDMYRTGVKTKDMKQ